MRYGEIKQGIKNNVESEFAFFNRLLSFPFAIKLNLK